MTRARLVREYDLIKSMILSAPKKYLVYCSVTGLSERFETVEGAAAGFYEADVQHRPCVVYGNRRTAQVIGRTVIVGDRIEKSLPVESHSAFTDAYLVRQGRGPKVS
ncbi:hypothetical protein [Fluviibacterium sp. S390]|uniref:hypothetical protein n=1 Tax=Fluviibacterium sp. S390 TaxID=3415139 RepID=UPI003C7D7420